MKVQYADEVVVVINPQPMKTSNGMEDKTEGTSFIVMMTDIAQKVISDAKDEKSFKVYSKVYEAEAKVLKEG
jgi:hypothetical protein